MPRKGMTIVRDRIKELDFRQDWQTNLFWVSIGLIPALGFSFVQSLQVDLLSASAVNLVVVIAAGSLFGSSVFGCLIAHLSRSKTAAVAHREKRHVLEDFDNLLAPHQVPDVNE